MKRRAVIDVGTNSVKLLVADVNGRDVRPVFEDSKQTRLGRGFYETCQLQPEAIAQTAEAVKIFAAAARELGAQSVRILATSAARDAKNPGDLASAVNQASGLPLEIITGEHEADLAYQGVTSDPRFADRPLLLLDIGGGSTEFILGHGEQKDFRHSFPLGAVRLLEQFPVSDPPDPAEQTAVSAWLKNFLQTEVRPKIRSQLYYENKFDRVQLVGTGGTATILARIELQMSGFDRAQIESANLTLPRIREHAQRLWNLPLAERKKITGLPPKRADVILTGALILQAIMEEFGFAALAVSTRGLRFAAVMQP